MLGVRCWQFLCESMFLLSFGMFEDLFRFGVRSIFLVLLCIHSLTEQYCFRVVSMS